MWTLAELSGRCWSCDLWAECERGALEDNALENVICHLHSPGALSQNSRFVAPNSAHIKTQCPTLGKDSPTSSHYRFYMTGSSVIILPLCLSTMSLNSASKLETAAKIISNTEFHNHYLIWRKEEKNTHERVKKNDIITQFIFVSQRSIGSHYLSPLSLDPSDFPQPFLIFHSRLLLRLHAV